MGEALYEKLAPTATNRASLAQHANVMARMFCPCADVGKVPGVKVDGSRSRQGPRQIARELLDREPSAQTIWRSIREWKAWSDPASYTRLFDRKPRHRLAGISRR